MLEYDRIHISEDIDTNKTDGWHECIICYWFFPKANFRFQQKIYSGCPDMTQKYMNFNNSSIFTIGQ